jgi:purine-binding chemotaxis protein CheW
MQYLTFSLDGVEYAVDVRIVEAVVEYEGATLVPTPLAYMRGVMDIRGRILPLIDLRRKLGLSPRDDTTGASVIVFGVPGNSGVVAAPGEESLLAIGALVDAVSEVLTIDEAGLEAAGDAEVALWERFVRGIARVEGRMVVIIRPEGLFSLEEIASLRVA